MTDKLFFDTDCISSFLWINDTSIIENLYSGLIVIPEPVYNELSNPCVPHLKQQTDKLIDSGIAKLQEISVDSEEYKLYQQLIQNKISSKSIGNGEAAGIALARLENGVLASNNYKDIAPYIEKYKLNHIDTGTILIEALNNNIIDEKEGNNIWTNMLRRNRFLPEKTFSDYLRKNK